MVSVSSCHDVSYHPLIDVLEVYARPTRVVVRAGSIAQNSTNASNTHGSLAVPAPAVQALSACSRLLAHAVSLALTAEEPNSVKDDDVEVYHLGNGVPKMEETTLRAINVSATSVLRNTCLAAEPARLRDLRSASRSLLAVVMPDAERRASHVDNAHVEEARRVLLGGNGLRMTRDAEGLIGAGAREARVDGSLSPVLLRRVAQRCTKVCARRPELLRDELAPMLAMAPSAHVHRKGAESPGGNSGSSVSQLQSFVFPALIQRFWESCVWRRDGRESMEVVLFDVLRLAVYEMRAAGMAAARATESTTSRAVTMSGTDAGKGCEDRPSQMSKPSEKDILRAGLKELLPLLQSNVARVAQATSSQLAALLLGPRGEFATQSTRTAASSASRSSSRRQSKVQGSANAGGSFNERLAAGEHGPCTGLGDGASDSQAAAGPETAANPRSTFDAAGGERDANGVGDTSTLNIVATVRAGDGASGCARAGSDEHDKVARESEMDAGGQAPTSSTAEAAEQAAIDRAFNLATAVPTAAAAAAASSDNLLPGDTAPPPRKRSKPSSSASDGSEGDGMDAAGESFRQEASQSAAAAAVTGSGAASPAVGSEGASTTTIATTSAVVRKICYRCDGCNDFPLQYVRHHCLVCADFDLCPRCYEVFHGPNNQFQGGNVILLEGHSTAHGMVALQVGAVD